MTVQTNWLREQRASGGYSAATGMLIMSSDAEKYVEFFINRIERDHEVNLDLYVDFNGFEIYAGDQIVWFGRPQDVDLLRTVRFNLFEEIILKRLERLKEMELLPTV